MTDRLLFIGDGERAEFARLTSALSRIYRVSAARNPRMALRAMRGGEQWSPILLAPSYPGEFSVCEWDELRLRQPSAEFSLVVGSWTEGETRSGKPWPDLPRTYVDQWLARCVVQSAGELRSIPAARGLLTVCADDISAQDYLKDFGRSIGWDVQLPTDTASIAHADSCSRHVILYDAPSGPGPRAQRVRELVHAYPQTRLIVLIGFPREWEVAELTALGATAVLGKPFLNDDLCRYLNATADIISAVRAA